MHYLVTAVVPLAQSVVQLLKQWTQGESLPWESLLITLPFLRCNSYPGASISLDTYLLYKKKNAN